MTTRLLCCTLALALFGAPGSRLFLTLTWAQETPDAPSAQAHLSANSAREGGAPTTSESPNHQVAESPSSGEPLPFRRAVELALTHSGLMKMAAADQQRAHQGYREARAAYLPQMVIGSGLAWTYGYPLSIEGSAPSIIDFGEQQALFNPAQHEFVNAAHREWDAATYLSQDRKNAVILEAALTYSQLDALTSMLSVLRQQLTAAQRAQEITSQRVQAGLDSQVTLTRAQLATAKANVKIAELEGNAEMARTRLSQLTGVSPGAISTATESIPKLPDFSAPEDLITLALNRNPEVKQAEENEAAKHDRAKGEHKVQYPAVDFVAQYGLFSKANNFQDFFKRFQRNNATVGVSIRFPFLNFAQDAHAASADFEALTAQAQTQGVKEQITNDTMKLQRQVRQTAAAKEVARLEYELARSDTEAAQARVQAGTASLKDQESALAAEQESYLGLLESTLEFDTARIQLLRQTGQIEQWALGTP